MNTMKFLFLYIYLNVGVAICVKGWERECHGDFFIMPGKTNAQFNASVPGQPG